MLLIHFRFGQSILWYRFHIRVKRRLFYLLFRTQQCNLTHHDHPLLRPIREESQRLLADKAYLQSVCESGAQKAAYVAEKTLRKVYKKVGFVAR